MSAQIPLLAEKQSSKLCFCCQWPRRLKENAIERSARYVMAYIVLQPDVNLRRLLRQQMRKKMFRTQRRWLKKKTRRERCRSRCGVSRPSCHLGVMGGRAR